MALSSEAQPASSTQRGLFLSYARADQEILRELVEGITELLDYRLWIDRKLDGGQAWWDEILRQIRNCDAMVVAVSPNLVNSNAAFLEREYARRVGKRLVPVMINFVAPELLPPDLAHMQIINYTENRGTGQLVKALMNLPPAPPLPHPLPQPPAVPVSYLAELAQKVRMPVLSYEEQMGLVGKLGAALAHPGERNAALHLLGQLSQRNDLLMQPGTEIKRLLDNAPPDTPAAPGRGRVAPETGSRPSRHLALSIAALVLTLLPLFGAPGLLCLYYTWRVETLWARGDVRGATKASKNALIIGLIGIGIGILFWSWALSPSTAA